MGGLELRFYSLRFTLYGISLSNLLMSRNEKVILGVSCLAPHRESDKTSFEREKLRVSATHFTMTTCRGSLKGV